MHYRDSKQESPLIKAVYSKNLEIIQLLREAGGKLSLHTVDIGIAICLAISRKDVLSVEAWYRAGADFSEADYHGKTPLHAAVAARDLDMIRFLCERGADPNSVDSSGKSPIDDAMLSEREDIVNLLKGYISKENGNVTRKATFEI